MRNVGMMALVIMMSVFGGLPSHGAERSSRQQSSSPQLDSSVFWDHPVWSVCRDKGCVLFLNKTEDDVVGDVALIFEDNQMLMLWKLGYPMLSIAYDDQIPCQEPQVAEEAQPSSEEEVVSSFQLTIEAIPDIERAGVRMIFRDYELLEVEHVAIRDVTDPHVSSPPEINVLTIIWVEVEDGLFKPDLIRVEDTKNRKFGCFKIKWN